MVGQSILNWLVGLMHKVFGSSNDRYISALLPIVAKINNLESEMRKLPDSELTAKTAVFRERHLQGESLDDLLPEAFAAVREAGRRTLVMRHFDVQLIGGIILHRGAIAEMVTGEGKTLTSTLAAYLNALPSKGVHVVTVNDYLAQRDADWNRPLFTMLGLTVGAIQSNMRSEERLSQYACDVTYGTNNEFGFDYLRDNMKMSHAEQCQKFQHYAIIDEVDSILIDEARTPLIISGPAEDSPAKYYEVDKVARKLRAGSDFEIKEKEQQCPLTEEGIHRAEQLAGVDTFYSGANMDWPHMLSTALRARNIYKKDKDYVVTDGQVIIVDEFTGRLMEGRRWSDGLHQSIEAKEGLKIQEENQTLATITFQNFFRMYDKIAGMTGTALTEAGEFHKIYSLDCVAVPTNQPLIRKSYEDVIYMTEREKYKGIAEEVEEVFRAGRPVLVGTTSIEKSEQLSAMLLRRGVKHEVLNAKHHDREATIIAKAGQGGSVTIATNMAGRGTDIVLGPGVVELGGLHIVGTERHESRRVDNQLRGRAGRQGDPGSSRFFLSLEDDLMRIFAGPMVRNLMGKLAEEGMDIRHPMVSSAITRAQKKVESHNFEIRKNLLEYDKVMDKQRKIVYERRNKILRGEEVKGEVVEWLGTRVEGAIDTCLPQSLRRQEWDAARMSEFLQTHFDLEFSAEEIEEEVADGRIGGLEETLKERLATLYKEREGVLGDEMMRELEGFLMLNAIDTKWKDHLHAMDNLREAVGLEGMAGKDPKIVYSQRGWEYFDMMIEGIKEEVTDLVLRMEYQSEDQRRLGDIWDIANLQHDDMSGYNTRGAMDAALASDMSEAPPEPIRRKGQKIGRNDPCTCGSGKKYKKCCGAR